jgi:uncharacterized protein
MLLTSIHAMKPFAYLRRLLILICGLFTCATGIVFTYRSDLGLGPWDVLHKGISLHTPLSFGQASIVVGALIILLGLLLKVRPGMGTVLNMLLIGVFVDWQLRIGWISDLGAASFVLRLVVDAIGVLLMGIGTALYITPHLGAGPRDGLMLRLNTLTHVRIAIVRAAIECSALILGFFLGGTVGIGTLIFAFGVGPSVEIGFWLLKTLLPDLAPRPVDLHLPPARTLASDLVPHHPASHPVDQRSS